MLTDKVFLPQSLKKSTLFQRKLELERVRNMQRAVWLSHRKLVYHERGPGFIPRRKGAGGGGGEETCCLAFQSLPKLLISTPPNR